MKTTLSFVTDDYGNSLWRAIVSEQNGCRYLAVIEAYALSELEAWLISHGYPIWQEEGV